MRPKNIKLLQSDSNINIMTIRGVTMESIETKEGKEYLRFYELFTEEGPIYIYEKYQTDPNARFNNEVPETREFFTQEEATKGPDSVSFLDGRAVFPRDEKDENGITTTVYMRLLTASEFLGKVLPFLDTDEKNKAKEKEVQRLLENKANNVVTKRIVVEPPKVSEEQRNKVARKILRQYIK